MVAMYITTVTNFRNAESAQLTYNNKLDIAIQVYMLVQLYN